MTFFSGAVQDGPALFAGQLRKRYKQRGVQEKAPPAHQARRQKKERPWLPMSALFPF
jgi:hypothetical protein